MVAVDIRGIGDSFTTGPALLSVSAYLRGRADSYSRGHVSPPYPVSDRYLTPLQQLLPRGPLWTRDEDTNLTELLRGLSYQLNAVERRGLEFLSEVDPRTASDLLTAWETALGLVASGTVAERRAALVALLRGHDDPTQANLAALAVALGYVDATIKVYNPFVAGSGSGSPACDPDWQFRFEVVRLTRGATVDATLAAVIDAVSPLHTYHGQIDSYSLWRQRDVTGSWLAAARGPGPVWLVAGAAGAIKTSPNFIDWTTQTAAGGFVDGFNAGTYGEGLFVLVGDNGEIQTSTDGETWTHRANDGAYAGDFFGVGYGNGLFVAVGSSAEIQTSPDGVTWTHRSAGGGFADDFYSIVWSDDFEKWFAGGFACEMQTSPTGTTWTSQGGLSGGNLLGLAAGGGVVIGVGNTGGAIRTFDGTTWDFPGVGDPTETSMSEIIYSALDGLFIVGLIEDDTGRTAFARSADLGGTWHLAIDDDKTFLPVGAVADAAGTAIFVGLNTVFSGLRDDA